MKQIFLILTLLSSTVSFARERREAFNGVRGLGMGDTYVASVNDETALASNPAALGKLRDFFGTVIDPELDMNSYAQDLFKAKPFSSSTKLDEVIPNLTSAPGTYYHSRFQVMPSFVAKNFGIGIYMSDTLGGEAASATAADVFYRSDLAVILGYNLRLWDGRIKIGFSGKMMSRVELDETALDTTQALDTASLATAGLLKEGLGMGTDVSLLLTAPWSYLPSIGAVIHDMGGTSFSRSSGMRLSDATARPNIQKQDMDVGVSISPIHQNNVRSLWTLEYRGLMTASDEEDKAKLVHFGTEFNFGDVFFLRAGYNQRYWTAGAELASERTQFQMASYGEEVGTAASPREDRRFVLKAALRF